MTDQCPDGNAGPTCGLLPHDDFSSDIAEKFYPPPPTNRTDMADIAAIKAMFIDLNTTVQHVSNVSIFRARRIRSNCWHERFFLGTF